MPEAPCGARRRVGGLLAALAVVLVPAGCGRAPAAVPATTPVPHAVPAAAPPTPPPTATPTATPTARTVPARVPPAALDVPAIGVHTTGLVALGLTPLGAMEVPDGAVTAGWFALGPVPGDPGPAVLAAHVSWAKVAGVFARLHEMRVGDAAIVTRADGRAVRFTAYRVERFGKTAFPTADVYGNTEGPELRLITCGGEFDRAARSYRDNVVVFARAA